MLNASKHNLPIMKRTFLNVSFFACAFCPLFAFVDDNSNGLSDVWEQRYNATSLQLDGDADGDGFSHLEECIAGTDPFDADSRPQIRLDLSGIAQNEVAVHFQSFLGKSYSLYGSSTLSGFEPIIVDWPGTGKSEVLRVDTDGPAAVKSFVRADFWGDLAPSSIEDLTSLATYPDEPDGFVYLSATEAPDFVAAGYGARFYFLITPPESGVYNFFLSAAGPAELYFGSEVDGSDASKIAEVLPAQAGLSAEEWTTYDTQRGGAHTLVAGESYYLELPYIAVLAGQHVQVGWSGPGISGIEKITTDDLAEVELPDEFLLHSRTPLLAHDYDTNGQTGALWSAFSTVEAGANLDMSENVGHFNTTTGSSWSLTHKEFDISADTHLYATWLFRMGVGHAELNFMLKNRSAGNTQEGPKFSLESPGRLRAGSSSGPTADIDLNLGQTYRLEIISTLSDSGFGYSTPSGDYTVAADRFDLYVTDMSGTLVGFQRDMIFRDEGANLVEFIDDLQLYGTGPDIYFDDWLITDGAIAGDGYLVANVADYSVEPLPAFYNMQTRESDQDADGLADWEELALGANFEILFFDAQTTDGIDDPDVLSNAFSSATGTPFIEMFGSDACAMESNYPNTIRDDGEITIRRSGSLKPISVELYVIPLANTGSTTTICNGVCCQMVGTAGDEVAEVDDYVITDEAGNVITNTVDFDFGETEKVLTVKAVDDSINEYPETLNLGVQAAADGSYEVSDLVNGATIQIFDLPDSPDNLTLFTGVYTQDGAATVATTATGTITGTLNGPRTELKIWNTFTGLTSTQTTSHVHKANQSGGAFTPGNIVFGINEVDGVTPLLGNISEHVWDLTTSSGATSSTDGTVTSRQVIIDSLFGQNDETPLYLNVHSSLNTAGEIWAFFGLSAGSIEEPDAPEPPAAPGSSEFPQLTGDLLEVEVRRFLNQATFGATEAMVEALLSKIETERLSDASYHRYDAFADWMDVQMDKTQTTQTYLLDYLMATHFQLMWLVGVFDPALNPTDGVTATPTAPTVWPSIDRSNSDPAYWFLSDVYPATFSELELAGDNGLGIDRRFTKMPHVTMTHWHTMLNAGDQLRQKMGFALQQIVVASNEEGLISNNRYGMLNYQDMLNHYAFEYYRDVLGFVNWSPIMGIWLSSLKNQKAIDFDGDGLFDSYPDENLARENMQLFSIGLFDLWTDGSLKLTSEGLPKQTYTNDDIKEFAKILTGQSINYHDTTWGGDNPLGVNFVENANFNQGLFGGQTASHTFYPMKMFENYHSLGAKTFAGVTIDNTDITDLRLQAETDIEDAIDWLAGKPGDGQPDFDMVHSHVSTPAFISLRLIQRFTTSNPSREYLHRVATTFKDSEGNLGLTLKAILLDPEARTIDLNDTVFGIKKSPMEGFLQLLRVTEAHTLIPLEDPQGAAPFDTAPGDFTNPDLYLENFGYPTEQVEAHASNQRIFLDSAYTTSGSSGLQMNPFYQETVFNYYIPEYIPGGAIGAAELYAPEMQIVNEADVIRHINYFEAMVDNGFGPTGDELGHTDANQVAIFGGDAAAESNDHIRIDLQALVDEIYPLVEPMATGTTTNTRTSYSTTSPHWVRLSRVGDTFTSSESADGLSWNVMETWTVSMADDVYIGIAVTSHDEDALTTAVFDNVNVTGGNGIWSNRDIGDILIAGSLAENGTGEYTIQAAGADIWDYDDQFHYMYQTLSGDGTIVAEVKSLVNTNSWAKAGVMIRETLGDNSVNVSTLVTASRGLTSQARQELGRSAESYADEILVDALDDRLTNGLFRMRYPFDRSDNGIDDIAKNPREWIIDTITKSYGNPYDGSSDADNRFDKISDALYLLTASPEFQVRK